MRSVLLSVLNLSYIRRPGIILLLSLTSVTSLSRTQHKQRSRATLPHETPRNTPSFSATRGGSFFYAFAIDEAGIERRATPDASADVDPTNDAIHPNVHTAQLVLSCLYCTLFKSVLHPTVRFSARANSSALSVLTSLVSFVLHHAGSTVGSAWLPMYRGPDEISEICTKTRPSTWNLLLVKYNIT